MSPNICAASAQLKSRGAAIACCSTRQSPASPRILCGFNPASVARTRSRSLRSAAELRVPDAVQRANAAAAEPGPNSLSLAGDVGPGSAAHHFVLHSARDTGWLWIAPNSRTIRRTVHPAVAAEEVAAAEPAAVAAGI